MHPGTPCLQSARFPASAVGSTYGFLQDIRLVEPRCTLENLLLLKVLAGALESLSEEAKPLGLRFFWIKTEVEAFDDFLDAIIESFPLISENVKSRRRSSTLTASFTRLPAAKYVEVNLELGRASSVMNSVDERVPVAIRTDEEPEFLARWSSPSCCISVKPGL